MPVVLARGLFATGVSLVYYRWHCDLVLADDQQGLRLPGVAHTAHALVLGVHAVHMNERLGNLVHPGCVFGHPPVEQEVDVANPSGAVSPEGRKLRSEPD